MVPFLNSILGTMLPMLGMAKQDHMKSVFCYGKVFPDLLRLQRFLDVLWETFSLPWKRRDCGRGPESWLGWTFPECLGAGTWLALGRDG